MHAPDSYDYAVVRVVPRVERGEFINVGVIVSCESKGFLEARFDLDEARLRALDPAADIDAIRRQLQAIARICTGGPDAGPIGRLPRRARFHWLTAKRSSIIQTAPSHMGRCTDPAGALEHLLDRMVRVGAR